MFSKQQVQEKSESNYEEEKKRVEYRQTEQIIIDCERLWLVRGLVIQKK